MNPMYCRWERSLQIVESIYAIILPGSVNCCSNGGHWLWTYVDSLCRFFLQVKVEQDICPADPRPVTKIWFRVLSSFASFKLQYCIFPNSHKCNLRFWALVVEGPRSSRYIPFKSVMEPCSKIWLFWRAFCVGKRSLWSGGGAEEGAGNWELWNKREEERGKGKEEKRRQERERWAGSDETQTVPYRKYWAR